MRIWLSSRPLRSARSFTCSKHRKGRLSPYPREGTIEDPRRAPGCKGVQLACLLGRHEAGGDAFVEPRGVARRQIRHHCGKGRLLQLLLLLLPPLQHAQRHVLHERVHADHQVRVELPKGARKVVRHHSAVALQAEAQRVALRLCRVRRIAVEDGGVLGGAVHG